MGTSPHHGPMRRLSSLCALTISLACSAPASSTDNAFEESSAPTDVESGESDSDSESGSTTSTGAGEGESSATTDEESGVAESTTTSGDDSTSDDSSGEESDCAPEDCGQSCAAAEDCPPSELCIDFGCVLPSLLGPCPLDLDLEPLSLPPGLPPALAADFIDVDDDGEAELVLVHVDGITVVDGDTRIDTDLAVPGSGFDGLTAIDLDGLDGIDLVLTHSQVPLMHALFGAGDGSFVDETELPTPAPLGAAAAIDGDLDGDLELAALFVPDMLDIIVFGLDGPGLLESHLLGVPNGHEDIVIADLNADGHRDMLIIDGSSAHRVRAEPGGEWSSGGQLWGIEPGWAQGHWAVGELGAPDNERAVALSWTGGLSVLQTWTGPFYGNDTRIHAVLADEYREIAFARLELGEVGESLILLGPHGGVRIGATRQSWLGCVDSLPGLDPLLDPPSSPTPALFTGDHDADGHDEIASLDAEGVVHLYRRSSP